MRKIDKKCIRGKKASGEGINWKLIIAVIVILVVVIAIFSLWKFGVLDKLKNLFPDFG